MARGDSEKAALVAQTTAVRILAQFRSSCVILDELINLSGPYFLILKNYLTGLVLGLNGLISVKCLE